MTHDTRGTPHAHGTHSPCSPDSRIDVRQPTHSHCTPDNLLQTRQEIHLEFQRRYTSDSDVACLARDTCPNMPGTVTVQASRTDRLPCRPRKAFDGASQNKPLHTLDTPAQT
eukprot:m.428991 g.428991  ORF g.428991 m.428991 type:complete len:112 (+) comp20235_c0_seq7:2134-2469(+)